MHSTRYLRMSRKYGGSYTRFCDGARRSTAVPLSCSTFRAAIIRAGEAFQISDTVRMQREVNQRTRGDNPWVIRIAWWHMMDSRVARLATSHSSAALRQVPLSSASHLRVSAFASYHFTAMIVTAQPRDDIETYRVAQTSSAMLTPL